MALLRDQAKRMALERRLLEEAVNNTQDLSVQGWTASEAGELCVNFELKLLTVAFAGVLVYPELFPDVPAFVRPQNSRESWSGHQYGGSGVLCLEYGPDNWHPGITGVELVRSARKLIWGEILHGVVPNFGPVESRHHVSAGQLLSDNNERLLVTKLLKTLLAGPGRDIATQLQGVVDWLTNESVAVVVKAGDPLVALGDAPDSVLQGAGITFSGFAVPVPSAAALTDAKDVQDLEARLGSAWPWDEGLGEEIHLLLAHDAEGQLCSFLLKGGSNRFFRRYYPMVVSGGEAQRLPAHFSKLSAVSVAIVGMGSLGSKIAVSLARAGVRDFVLLDDDVVLPHNLVRNQLNWLDVGFSKLNAGARALKQVAPDLLVSTWPIRIAEQGNPSITAAAAKALAGCTLVIDATANPGAFVALAAITKRAGNAMVWGEVFGGGGGALMARSRPGIDADALSIRAHLHGVMENMAPAPAGRPTAYGVETDGMVYVASDADVGSLAASMTQFSLDVLCADPSEYPAAAYLIGFRKFWEFRCPFDVIPVDCPMAGEAQTEQVLSEEERFAIASIQKSIDEAVSATNHGAS